ncbi:hypothetical protein PLUA15_200021 [Pseudomonas lundensis]|uniref:Uncharacterized protein n=1 Tax=Pseudomonas lundensis TaxID=86185 RepID=A0AAX2H6J3_9PSED|nr:hypothetical protein PLUA15_200021 [Pseudomonas lundensis]
MVIAGSLNPCKPPAWQNSKVSGRWPAACACGGCGTRKRKTVRVLLAPCLALSAGHSRLHRRRVLWQDDSRLTHQGLNNEHVDNPA